MNGHIYLKGRIQVAKYVLALDQGTTSSRAIVFDKKGNIVAKAQKEFDQIYPAAGWVEHDPMEILFSQFQAVTSVFASGGIKPEDIAAIGITNQRETTIMWQARLQRHRLAVPPHSGALRADKGGRHGGIHKG